jgi:hypothetical protein
VRGVAACETAMAKGGRGEVTPLGEKDGGAHG